MDNRDSDEDSKGLSSNDIKQNKYPKDKINYSKKLKFYKKDKIYTLQDFKSMLKSKNDYGNSKSRNIAPILLTEKELKLNRAKSHCLSNDTHVKSSVNNNQAINIKNFPVINFEVKQIENEKKVKTNNESNFIASRSAGFNLSSKSTVTGKMKEKEFLKLQAEEAEAKMKEEREKDINALRKHYNQTTSLFDKQKNENEKRALFKQFNIKEKISTSEIDYINTTLNKVKRNYYDYYLPTQTYHRTNNFSNTYGINTITTFNTSSPKNNNINNNSYNNSNPINPINTVHNSNSVRKHLDSAKTNMSINNRLTFDTNYERVTTKTRVECVNELYSNPIKAMALVKQNMQINKRCDEFYNNMQIEKYNEKFEQVSYKSYYKG